MIRFYVTDDINNLPSPILEVSNHQYLENNTVEGNKVILTSGGNYVGRGIYKIRNIVPIAEGGGIGINQDITVLLKPIAISLSLSGGSGTSDIDMGNGYGSGYLSGIASGNAGSGEFGSTEYGVAASVSNVLAIGDLVNRGVGSWTAVIQLSNISLINVSGNVDLGEVSVSIKAHPTIPNKYVIVSDENAALEDPSGYASVALQISYSYNEDPSEGIQVVNLTGDTSDYISIVEIP